MKEIEGNEEEEEKEETVGFSCCPFCIAVQPVFGRSTWTWDLGPGTCSRRVGAKRAHGLEQVLFSSGWGSARTRIRQRALPPMDLFYN